MKKTRAKKTKEQQIAALRKKIARAASVAIAAHKANIGKAWEEINKAHRAGRLAPASQMNKIIQDQREVDRIMGLGQTSDK